MKRLLIYGMYVLVFAGLVGAQPVRAAVEDLTISQPARDGVSTGCRVTVEGTAALQPGEHLWIFATRKDFGDLGLVWLQGEADVDSATKKFVLPVTLGIESDIGSTFRVSAAILNDATHNRMRAKLMDMMATNRHLPVPFPSAVYAPKHRMIKKVSHEGC